MPWKEQTYDNDVVMSNAAGRAANRVTITSAHEDVCIYKFGLSDAIGPNDRLTLWTAGGSKVWEDVDQSIYVSSENVADTSVPIIMELVDQDHRQTTVTVSTDALDGRTPVFVGQGVSIQRGRRMGACLGDIWAGTGVFALGVPSVPQMHIPQAEGSTFHGFYTVPSEIQGQPWRGGWRASLRCILYSSKSAATGYLKVALPGYEPWTIDRQQFEGTAQGVDFGPGLVGQMSGQLFIPGTRFELQGESASGSIELGGRFNIELMRYEP